MEVGNTYLCEGLCKADPSRYLPPKKRRVKVLYQDPKAASIFMEFAPGGIWWFIEDGIWDW